MPDDHDQPHHSDGGYRGYGGYPYFLGAGALGFALGASLANPWYYGYPAYYGYPGYYDYDDGYYEGYAAPGGAYPPPPAQYPPSQYQAPQSQAAPNAACGSWSWDPAHAKYNWIPC